MCKNNPPTSDMLIYVHVLLPVCLHSFSVGSLYFSVEKLSVDTAPVIIFIIMSSNVQVFMFMARGQSVGWTVGLSLCSRLKHLNKHQMDCCLILCNIQVQ